MALLRIAAKLTNLLLAGFLIYVAWLLLTIYLPFIPHPLTLMRIGAEHTQVIIFFYMLAIILVAPPDHFAGQHKYLA